MFAPTTIPSLLTPKPFIPATPLRRYGMNMPLFNTKPLKVYTPLHASHYNSPNVQCGIYDSFASTATHLFNSEMYHDIILKYGNTSLKSHRFMLHVHSKVLSKALEQMNASDEELVIEPEECITEEHFTSMVRFFYGFDVQLNDDNIMDIIRVALHFKCALLSSKCAAYLMSVVNEKRCNASMVDLAMELGDEDFIGLCITRMDETPVNFNHLAYKQLLKVLRSDYLSMSEVEILSRVQQYVAHREMLSRDELSEPLSATQISRLYECVRLPQMSLEELRDIVKPLVAQDIIPQDDLLRALEYHTDPWFLVQDNRCKGRHSLFSFSPIGDVSGLAVHPSPFGVLVNNQSLGPLKRGCEIRLTFGSVQLTMQHVMQIFRITLKEGLKDSTSLHEKPFPSVLETKAADKINVSDCELKIRIERDMAIVVILPSGSVWRSEETLRDLYPEAGENPELYLISRSSNFVVVLESVTFF